MNNEPIKLDFTIPCYLYWYNVNASGPWVTATDETLARVGYVPAALLASATARATEAERDLEQTQDAYAKAQECPARLVTIVDEAFGVQPVMQFDELLDRLESKLTEMRLDAAEADRERDEALKRVRVSAAKIDDLTETAARVIVERDALRVKLAEAQQERDGVSVRLARALDVIKAARLYRTGKAPLGLLFKRLDAHDVTSNAIIDAVVSALTPSPASEQSWPCKECAEEKDGACKLNGEPVSDEDDEWCKSFTRRLPVVQPARTCGETQGRANAKCGECEHHNGAMWCKRINGSRGRLQPIGRCEDFTRRLPVVRPALGAPCGQCCYDGEEDCIHADGEASDPACPGFKEAIPVVDPKTCGECASLSFRNVCTTEPNHGDIRGTADPACPAFVGKDGEK